MTRGHLRRIGAVGLLDLRILRADPAFLIIFTVIPVAYMAFSEKAMGAALRLQHPGQHLSGAAFTVPAAAVLFSGFMVGNLGFGIFREHGWSTWERLRGSALSPFELMAGKSLVPILTLVLQIAVLLGGGSLMFDLHLRGSLLAFLLVAAAMAVMEVALAFMLLSVCRSVIQLNAVTNAGTLLLGGFAGALTPIEFLPGWAQAVAPVTPPYWAIKGFRRVTIESGGLADVAVPIAVLLAFAVVFALVAANRLDLEAAKTDYA